MDAEEVDNDLNLLNDESKDADLEEICHGLNTKIQTFYYNLRSDGKFEDLVASLNEIECHVPDPQLLETEQLCKEIVEDCQKKCAQVIRALYAEMVRNSIAASRKKLANKVAKDAESSHQHGQRHLNTIIELLGAWSNAIAEMHSLNLSSDMMIMIAAQMHSRIIDAALQCFQAFKEDKGLDSWQARLRALHTTYKSNSPGKKSSSSNSGSAANEIVTATASVNVNLSALDFILSQMSGMREIVNQYYRFIATRVGPDAFSGEKFVSTNELNHWRELDAYYSSLECAYLECAVHNALQETHLIETEAGVRVPQSLEDLIFLVRKTTDRSLATGSATIAMLIGNKIIELIDCQQESPLYSMVTSAKTFTGCYNQQQIWIEGMNSSAASGSLIGSGAPSKIIQNTVSMNSKMESVPDKAGSGGILNTMKDIATLAQDESFQQSSIGGAVASEIGSELAELVVNKLQSVSLASLASSVSFAGVNSWLLGLGADSSHQQQVHDTQEVAIQDQFLPTLDNIIPALSSDSPKPALGNRNTSSTSNLDEMLIQALEGELQQSVGDNDLGFGLGLGLLGSDDVTLSFADAAVQLSSYAITMTLVSVVEQSFDRVYVKGMHSLWSEKERAQLSALSIILQELTRCLHLYKSCFEHAAHNLAMSLFQEYLRPNVAVVLSRSFVMDGKQMDSKLAECELSSVVRVFCSSEGSLHCLLLDKVSSVAAQEIVLHLARELNSMIIHSILRASFNEWGAQLFQIELQLICKHFDEVVVDDVGAIRSAFSISLWAAKLLTLDQPGDIRKYMLPSPSCSSSHGESETTITPIDASIEDKESPVIDTAILNDALVRAILATRVDFSPEAVNKVKITYSSS